MNGERVKDLRKERKWSQEKLGELVGLTQAQISKIEKGDSSGSIRTASDLAAVFGVEIGEIMLANPTRPLSGKATRTRRAGAGMEAAVSAGA